MQNWFDVTKPTDTAMLGACDADEIAYAPFFPLGGFGIPDHPRLKEIAVRHGATVPQVLLAGLLALPPAMLAIPGTSSPAHLEENIAAAALRLTREDMDALREIPTAA